MERSVPLMVGENYHVYNRGAWKQPIFLNENDCVRFQALMFLANSDKQVRLEDISARYKTQGRTLRDVFLDEHVNRSLVDILAYSLMPNHFHLVLRQKSYDGITTFMRKVCTGYSMYFNGKHDHSGTLFQGKFKSNHINTESYFNWIFAYVHLNPVALVEPKWDEKELENPALAQKFLDTYKYSSYYDFYVAERPERSILAFGEARQFIEKKHDVQALLKNYGRGRVLYENKQI